MEIPFDVKEAFGSLRPRVVAVFDGKESYRGSLVRMGDCHILGVRKDIRAKLDKQPGDELQVSLQADTAPREVEVPPQLAAEFQKHPGAKKRFDKMSYTHQREYVNYISEAKKEETRQRRAAKVISMLEQNKTK